MTPSVSDTLLSSRPAKRGCRVYQTSTIRLVRRAACSWSNISGLDFKPFSFEGGTCFELSRYVKKFLGQEVSDDPSLQMGFQSIKKLLPDSCRCMESGLLDDLVARLGQAPRELPVGYIAFVQEEVARLFPKGWDAAYEGHCVTTVPPLSSTLRSPRSAGGALSASVSLGGQAEYLERVLHGRGDRLCPSYRGELLVVQSAGKPRPLSKFPVESLYLKPCHKTIYDHLSKFSWLLRGPPTEERMVRAGFKPHRGRLVSGDYASATDNLPVEVMEAALKVMLENASFIPKNVAELALRACRPILFSESLSVEISRGQMMGSLLSFPFLCLQNYLAFRWSLISVGKKNFVPVLINGDDILYQSPFEGFDQIWRSVVSALGLEVEVTKTSVSGLYGSLNSTLLRWDCGRLAPVWSPRFGMFRRPDDCTSLGKTFESFLSGCPPEFRFRAGKEFFSWHCGTLRSARVSLPSLGFRGLLARRLAKVFHLLSYLDADCPSYPPLHDCGLPDGFAAQVPKSWTDSELRFAHATEVAAMVWARGFVPAERTKSAISYCIAWSRLKGRRHDYPFASTAVFSTAQFGWFVTEPALARPKRELWLLPRFSEGLVNISHAVLEASFWDLAAPPSYDWEPPPDDFTFCNGCRLGCFRCQSGKLKVGWRRPPGEN
jgi:hypothetical protein